MYENHTNSTVYKVTGYYDTYAKTEEMAENNIRDAYFGDLINVSWEKDFVDFTMDGNMNDLVHVIFIVTGDLPVAPDENPENYDIGEITEPEFELIEANLIDKVLRYLKESETYDDFSQYLQKRGTYAVSALYNDFMEPTGNDKTFTNPGKAVEYWFNLSKKYPTCVAITGYVKEENDLRQWVLANKDLVAKWHEKYKCPYKLDYLIDACKKPASRNDKYPDQMYPFCMG